MAIDFQDTGSMEIRDSSGVIQVIESMQIIDKDDTEKDIETFWVNIGPSGASAVWESVTFGYNVLTITETEAPVDLATYIPSGGFPFKLQVVVAAGALMTTDVGQYAFYSSQAFPANSDIKFIINGQIHGKNGAGGRGGGYAVGTAVPPQEGTIGADCISLPCDADIALGTNGELYSGGGGGGGAGGGGFQLPAGPVYGGGGGGGNPGGFGGVSDTNPGHNGTSAETGATLGGAALGISPNFGGRGGACEGPGLPGHDGGPGSDGLDIFLGKDGGPAGFSVKKNGFNLTFDAGDIGTKIRGGFEA
jgi:hypothetical protein